ncbi:MAG: hypothetical protein JL50_07390 [Peptococcaceae bacterium BICA1-7]|jgi:hypothetical protein|nr:MAG: hypothetical protein JL50_07390 [Peptococcaceae bacterium BICA1-7]HBV97934.1 hypothetical protein [Desulfotomaculum sp.]
MRSKIFKTLSLLILGIIFGAASTNIYMGMQLDYLSLTNKSLQESLAEAERQLQSLKESTEIKNRYSITSFDIFPLLDSREGLTDYDQLTLEYEVDKKVKEWLTPLIGKNISEVDALLVPRIVDSRDVEANGNTYRLRTYLVVINKKTSVYIKASLIKSSKKE